MVAQLHRERGVRLRLGAALREVRRTGPTAGHEVVLDDGSCLTSDLVVAAVGSTPNVGWLAGSGIDVEDGVLCDSAGRATPGVRRRRRRPVELRR
ncbi:hypothetical protein GCM10023169_24050 [Georgenia halophila]|uniref:FAD/NAD(P)-binding domain-containing protein n=2 Tax=Georgenia halophila TaxID=620889 RepID=A0ABP8LCL2_9MICO